MRIWFTLALLQLFSLPSESQFLVGNGAVSDGAVYCDSSVIKSWAVKCKISRGYLNIEEKNTGLASTGVEASCLGKADNVTASLGDSGIAVLSFIEPIADVPGNDFAVFENSFDGNFLELAFVEVSTDSLRWVRFPSVSLTQVNSQIGSFENMNASGISNLAGKYRVYYGTPFDLKILKDSAGINILNIRYVKILDVIGSISDKYALRDSKGNKINDPWPTPFPQSGFDLDAVAVLKSVQNKISSLNQIKCRVYPNPVKDFVNIQYENAGKRFVRISDLFGKIVISRPANEIVSEIDVSALNPGIYFIETFENRLMSVHRIIKE